MRNATRWELPFDQPAVLELRTEYGSLALLPIEAGQTPHLELSRGTADSVEVRIDKSDGVVRVELGRAEPMGWFGNWECRATLYVPLDVRAALQTNAGSISVRNLEGCELGIKASAGKIDLVDVYGLMHLAADAGSITGRGLGGLFDVEAQAGSVRMEILDLRPGEHRFRATMGSVRLELGRGMDVCIETHSSLGSVRNSYPVRADAPARLVLSTEMGSVRVDEASSQRATPRPRSSVDAWARTEASKADAPSPPREDPELTRILKMVEAGELSAKDADELLRAMGRV